MKVRTFILFVLSAVLMVVNLPYFLQAESELQSVAPLPSVFAQNEGNPSISVDEVYSLRRDSGEHLRDDMSLRLLAADDKNIVFTGDVKEAGYLAVLSHEKRELVGRYDVPGEVVYSAEIFGDGIVYAHVDQVALIQGAAEPSNANEKSGLKLSFVGEDGNVVNLWESESFYPQSVFSMGKVGDQLIFVFDEESEGGEERECNIGLLDDAMHIRMLLSERTEDGSDAMQLSAQPLSIADDRALIHYRSDRGSRVYEYVQGASALHCILFPESDLHSAWPLADGEILLSTFNASVSDGYAYFILGPERERVSADLPQDWKLQQLLSLDQEHKLWFFACGRDQRPILFGPRPDAFVSQALMDRLEQVDREEEPKSIATGLYKCFTKDHQVYLVENIVSTGDIRVMSLDVSLSPNVSCDARANRSDEASRVDTVFLPETSHDAEEPDLDLPLQDGSVEEGRARVSEQEAGSAEEFIPETTVTEMPLQGGSMEDGQAWVSGQVEAETPTTVAHSESGAKVMLNVPAQIQEEWYWCAPATVSMMLSSQGVWVEQADLAQEMGSYEPFGTHNANAVSVLNARMFGYGVPGEGQAGYRLATVTTSDPYSDEAALFKQRFRQNIDDGYPMYLTFDISHIYPGKQGEHNVPGIGYQLNADGTDVAYIYYLDPLASVRDPVYGGLMKVTPEEFMHAMLTCVEPNYAW